jgi:hypothetical protein
MRKQWLTASALALFAAVLVAAVAVRPAGAELPPGVTALDSLGRFLLTGKPVFPIVLAKGPPLDGTTPSGENALDPLTAAGVDFFKVGPALTPWTDADIADAEAWDSAVAARGAHTWINLDTLATAAPRSSEDALLQHVVGSLVTAPGADGIGMWKGADEPYWGHVPVEALRFPFCRVTLRGLPTWCDLELPLDPRHLWVTIEAPRGTAADLAPYSDVTDTHGVDVYPVTYTNKDPDLHQVGVWTKTIASVTPDRNVWATLEICATGNSGPNGAYVLPTQQQERYMIYDAIINGARGIAFYGGNIYRCWNDDDRRLGWNWTFWNGVLSGLVQEISAQSPLGPALLAVDTTRQLTSSDGSVEAISRTVGDDVWVVAAQNGDPSGTVTISGLPDDVQDGTVYTEGRNVTAHDGTLTDTFDRWGVHVYEFRRG